MSIGPSIEILDVAPFIDAAPSQQRQTPEISGVYNNEYTFATDSRYERILASGVTLKQYLDQCEREYVNYTLQKYQNSYKAAAALGTHCRTTAGRPAHVLVRSRHAAAGRNRLQTAG